MRDFNSKIKKIGIILLLFIISLSLAKLFGEKHYNSEANYPKTNINEQWLINNDFSTEEAWFSSKGDNGDNSTVEAFIDQGSANIRVLGETQLHEYSDSLNDGTWNKTRNENFVFPNVYAENRSYGLYVSHDYNEAVNQTQQYHSVHWRKIISTGLDMSKYAINDANLEVIFNATVSTNLETLGQGSRYTVGDFARFYVYISDIAESNRFRVAYNRTVSLGYDSSYTTIVDTVLETVSKNDIIQALESAFEKDPLRSRALLTIGIDVYCEDNEGSDRDTFTSLLVKSLNLTFTSVRSIKKFTTISWNQVSDSLDQDNIQIINARLGFSHKIDQLWPSAQSTFSELRIYLNENQFKDTILLSSMNGSFQDAKTGGFDVTNLILKNLNISVSLQLFIANDFGLNSNKTISIDDIFLFINYIFLEPGMNMLPLIIGLAAGIAGVTLLFALYQVYFKYPANVRKIRKLKKKVRKGKTMKPFKLSTRAKLIDDKYHEKIQPLNLEKNQERSKVQNKISKSKE